MSGRIGISLASTVSSVIDVPATHSSGRERDLPGLDRRDLVLRRGEHLPPADVMYATLGWTMTPGPDGGHDDDDRPRRRRSRRSSVRRAWVPNANASAAPTAALTSASAPPAQASRGAG